MESTVTHIIVSNFLYEIEKGKRNKERKRIFDEQ